MNLKYKRYRTEMYNGFIIIFDKHNAGQNKILQYLLLQYIQFTEFHVVNHIIAIIL